MFDLLLRDATVVSSAGRQVTDVGIVDGKISHVGPLPPRRKAKEEVSAMGRFLMPGVIDIAVQMSPASDSKVWQRESAAAVSGGVTTLMALPTGGDPSVDRASARRRAEVGTGASWAHFGLWGSATRENARELREATKTGLVRGVLARVGDDGLTPDDLALFAELAGVLAVQLDGDCSSEAALQNGVGKSVLRLPRELRRPIHLMHLSTSAELQLLDPVRGTLPVTSGVTPHHLFFAEESLNGLAERVRPRPPVRPEMDRRTLWTAIKRGRVDLVSSDHHVRHDAEERGVPGSELMFPLMLSAVKFGRLSLETLVALCAEGPARVLGLPNKGRVAVGADADLVLFNEGEITKVAEASLLSGAGWSPYADRESAVKPEMVVVDGRVVARKGRVVGDEPQGRFLGAEVALASGR